MSLLITPLRLAQTPVETDSRCNTLRADSLRLILIRGAPGSGKSTFARSQYPEHLLCEADQFFQGPAGYHFDSSRLDEAHAACLAKTKRALARGESAVVANTFTQLWELEPYVNIGVPFHVITCTGRWPNIHGVPEAVVERMRTNHEPFCNAEGVKRGAV